jgi:hypothetical protein
VRRYRILLWLLISAAPALHGQSFVLAGAGAGFVSQPTASMNPWSADSLGVILHAYNELAAGVGVYTAAAIGFIVASAENGVALNTGQYQTTSLDFILGIGTGVTLDRLAGVVGAGIYFGTNALGASNNTLSSFSAGGVGGGIGASLVYALSFTWGIGANINAAYYFAIPGATSPTMGPSGFCLFGGIGVVYYFRPSAALGPSVSHYKAERPETGQPALD